MTLQLIYPQKEPADRFLLSRPERLKKCYESAHPDFLYHMHEEVSAILKRVSRSDVILYNGCGYGRNIHELARVAKFVIGTDPCRDNIRCGRQWLRDRHNALLLEMTTPAMSFADNFFNKIVCLNNTFPMLNGDPVAVLCEFMRVLKKGGEIILSVYSGKYWEEHLAWYEIQSRNRLLAEIDYTRTRPGLLVCQDGHSIPTLTPERVNGWTAFLQTESQTETINDYCSFIIFRKTHGTVPDTESR